MRLDRAGYLTVDPSLSELCQYLANTKPRSMKQRLHPEVAFHIYYKEISENERFVGLRESLPPVVSVDPLAISSLEEEEKRGDDVVMVDNIGTDILRGAGDLLWP